MSRRIDWPDRLIAVFDQGLRSVAAETRPLRPSPADTHAEAPLNASERSESAALMRVNRAGEIAAQALYNGQALFARDAATTEHLRQAAREEADHLAWCSQRIQELGGRPSLLDPFWYLGSAAIGAVAGICGDSASLGFIAETERQVEAHIGDHLDRLPTDDVKSRAVLEQMRTDEARHGHAALEAGGRQIREPIRKMMAIGGEVVRHLAYRM